MEPYPAGDDLCLSFWSLAWSKDWIHFPQNARVLEIGCAEADWQTPMLALRPDLQITGLDWRACDRPGTTVRGNVMDPYLFPPDSFDAIVSVSAIEHVGLGAYDNDPQDLIGDSRAMASAHYWLKPGGWMYLDVPFRPDHYAEYASYRAYDQRSIINRLVPKTMKVKKSAKVETDHPDGPFVALLLEKV